MILKVRGVSTGHLGNHKYKVSCILQDDKTIICNDGEDSKNKPS